MLYSSRVDTPEAAGTFVVELLQLSPQHSQGATYSIYTPPPLSNTAHRVMRIRFRHILDFYDDAFGALPAPGLTVAQLTGRHRGRLRRSWPPATERTAVVGQAQQRLLADLVAHQWWGTQVTAATPSDVDHGRPFALFRRVVRRAKFGQRWLNKALEDLPLGALMFDESAPIADAGRLEPGTEEYQSVVVNKGAMVFHMLRAIFGTPISRVC